MRIFKFISKIYRLPIVYFLLWLLGAQLAAWMSIIVLLTIPFLAMGGGSGLWGWFFLNYYRYGILVAPLVSLVVGWHVVMNLYPRKYTLLWRVVVILFFLLSSFVPFFYTQYESHIYEKKQQVKDRAENERTEGKNVRYWNNGKLRLEEWYIRIPANERQEAMRSVVQDYASPAYIYIPHGPQKQYYQNGNLKKEANVVNGLLEGEVREYYESGELWIVYIYTNGELEKDTWYYKNGKIRGYTEYKNNESVSRQSFPENKGPNDE